jgi:hypothetical protein
LEIPYYLEDFHPVFKLKLLLTNNKNNNMYEKYVNPKILGIVIIGITIVLLLAIFSLTQTALKYGEELHKQCPLPPEICPIKRGVLPTESIIGLIFSAGLIGVSLYLIIFVKPVQVITKDMTKIKKIAKTLQGEERRIYELITEAGGSIFQSARARAVANLLKKPQIPHSIIANNENKSQSSI